MLVSYALVVLLVYSYLESSTRAALVLLVVFWALRLPILGQRLLVLTRSFPSAMNRVRRLLDMIGDVDLEPAARGAPAPHPEPPSTSWRLAIRKRDPAAAGSRTAASPSR